MTMRTTHRGMTLWQIFRRPWRGELGGVEASELEQESECESELECDLESRCESESESQEDSMTTPPFGGGQTGE